MAIAAIYAHHVRHGTASFGTEALDEHHWRTKIDGVKSRGWPFNVAERSANVVSYAYDTQFRDRAAYAATCENSIYVAPYTTGSRVGTALLAASVSDVADTGFAR